MNKYTGNPLQIRGAEKYTLRDGRGEGMNFLYIRNGLGLEVWLSTDRAGDPSRVIFKGDNMGYFSPCGYVSSKYYDGIGNGFLKSFTAGFFTTCGLTAVGSACTDEGEELPLHGNISHIPAVINCIEESDDSLTVKLTVEDAVIFGRKLKMKRKYIFSYTENTFEVEDTVINEGDSESPYMLLYHCNMGYPLLSESSIINIPNNKITPRDSHAAEFTASALDAEKPQANYRERCYYYDVKENQGIARAGIFNPTIGKGVILTYPKKELPCFTQWKMMGERDYVMGLEPGNCTPDGRDTLRKNKTLSFISPGEARTTRLKFDFTEKGEF